MILSDILSIVEKVIPRDFIIYKIEKKLWGDNIADLMPFIPRYELTIRHKKIDYSIVISIFIPRTNSKKRIAKEIKQDVTRMFIKIREDFNKEQK